MSLAARLRQALAPIPDGSTVPVSWVRGLLDEHSDTDATVDLTVTDVATMLGRAPSTCRTWCAAGRFPGAYRLQGREWRIPRSALRALRDAPEEPPRRQDGTVDLGSWRRAAR
jgi:excisionase family DNA binding protein